MHILSLSQNRRKPKTLTSALIDWKFLNYYNPRYLIDVIYVGKLLDNALVIHDYNGFNIWINNEKAATNVPANDAKWHHMAFTWKSSTGHWRVYKDGVNVKKSSQAFQQNQVNMFKKTQIINLVKKTINQVCTFKLRTTDFCLENCYQARV